MSKILKNTTGTDIELQIIGRTINASSQLVVDVEDLVILSSPESILEIAPLLNSGDLVVNDGDVDLSPELGLALIQGSYVKPAENLVENNRIKVDVTGTLSDGRVKVSNDDSTTGFLENKIVSVDNKISISILDAGNDEDLQLQLNPANIDTSELNNDANFLTETTHDTLPQDNPHSVTKTQVGLGNADNTSDVNKPVSTATQTALDLKYDASNPNSYETSTELNARDTANRSRSNHTGTQLASTISDLTTAIQSGETVTSIQKVGNILRYTNEAGADIDIDLSVYLDDTNLARIVSGTLNSSTGIVTFTRDDATTFTIDFSDITPIVEIQNRMYVAKNGNDTTGDGSLSKPYLTINRAITYLNTQTPSSINPFTIRVGGGLFVESPITIPEHVSITGSGFRQTLITPSDQNSDLVSITNNVSISGITLTGLSNASYYHIRLSGTSDTATVITNMSIANGVNGIATSSTVADYTAVISNCGFTGLAGVVVQTGSNTINNISSCRFIGNNTTTVGVQTTGDSITNIDGGTLVDCNYAILQQSTGETTATDTDLRNNISPLVKTNTSSVFLKGVAAKIPDALISEVSGLSGYVLDTTQEGRALRVLDELTVGVPGQGRESVFGEGDSYVSGMLVYTYDGSSYTDKTTEARSTESSTFGLPNNNVNTALYISTQRLTAGTTDPIKFFGVKVDCVTASVGGELVTEYWDGSSWIEFNSMSTMSGDKYLPHGKDIFGRSSVEQVRFDYHIGDDWQKNDPVSFGTNLYWIRVRVASSTSTSPIFEQIKIHSNRTEINEDGFMEYFGTGRSINILPFDSGTFQAANNSPTNQDLWLGDNLGVGRIENQFVSGTTDRVGLVRPLPLDLDTSCKLRLTLHLHSELVDTSPDIDFTIRYSASNVGSSVYDATTLSPTTAVGQNTVTVSATNPGQDKQFIAEVDLDVSDFVTRDSNNIGDLLWISIQRDNDGNASDVSLIQVEIQYVQWCNGGHQ
jgi:hypothetical protein